MLKLIKLLWQYRRVARALLELFADVVLAMADNRLTTSERRRLLRRFWVLVEMVQTAGAMVAVEPG